jgi:hypothetical protein
MKVFLLRMGSVWMMALVMLVAAVVQSAAYAAPAGMVSTQQLVQASAIDQQRTQVSEFMSRSDVQAQLQARGVDVADAQARIAVLTGAELAALAAQIDDLPAGAGGLETLLFLLVIFMLLDIAGVTDIFPGI